MRIWIGILLFAIGCSSGSDDVVRTNTASAAATPGSTAPHLTGRVADAAGGWAHLVAGDAAARSLPALAATVRDTVAIDADGRFAFEARRGADRVLLSVPGRALTSVALDADLSDLALAPEARVACRVTDLEGTPQEDALALALDADGRVLPLPPTELVANERGELTVSRLPAGRYELLIASGDDTLHATAAVTVAEGASTRLDVTLRADGPLRERWMQVIGAPWSPRTGGEERR